MDSRFHVLWDRRYNRTRNGITTAITRGRGIRDTIRQIDSGKLYLSITRVRISNFLSFFCNIPWLYEAQKWLFELSLNIFFWVFCKFFFNFLFFRSSKVFFEIKSFLTIFLPFLAKIIKNSSILSKKSRFLNFFSLNFWL